MGTATCSTGDLCLSRLTTPLAVEDAWNVESLLVEVFECGDYSFRAVLRGDYAQTLHCSFALAHQGDLLVGAAGCLQARTNPAVALLGPVAVRAVHRGRGIGTRLVRLLCDNLEAESCRAVYLGVANGHPAARLYARLGFDGYHGIVMRRLLNKAGDFDADYWRADASVKIRDVCWGDFPGVQALLVAPALMYTYDLSRSLFSSAYVPPERFLGVFPEMMKTITRQGGVAKVLTAGPGERIVGVAQARVLPGPARHVAELDFFVHDPFLPYAATLVQETILQCKAMPVSHIRCCCLGDDRWKRSILDQLGGRPMAVLKCSVRIGDGFMDTVVYQLE